MADNERSTGQVVWGVVKGVAKVTAAVTVAVAAGIGVGAVWPGAVEPLGIGDGLAKVAGAVGASASGVTNVAGDLAGNGVDALAEQLGGSGNVVQAEPVTLTDQVPDTMSEERAATIDDKAQAAVLEDKEVIAALKEVNTSLDGLSEQLTQLGETTNLAQTHINSVVEKINEVAGSNTLSVADYQLAAPDVDTAIENVKDIKTNGSLDISERAEALKDLAQGQTAEAVHGAQSNLTDVVERLQGKIASLELAETQIESLKEAGVTIKDGGGFEYVADASAELPKGADEAAKVAFERAQDPIKALGNELTGVSTGTETVFDAHNALVDQVLDHTQYTADEVKLGKAIIGGTGAAVGTAAIAHRAGRKQGWADRITAERSAQQGFNLGV